VYGPVRTVVLQGQRVTAYLCKFLGSGGHCLWRAELLFHICRTFYGQTAQIAANRVAAADRNYRNKKYREPALCLDRALHGCFRALGTRSLDLPNDFGLAPHSKQKKHTSPPQIGATIAFKSRANSGTRVVALRKLSPLRRKSACHPERPAARAALARREPEEGSALATCDLTTACDAPIPSEL
jgi:hypothetical protein